MITAREAAFRRFPLGEPTFDFALAHFQVQRPLVAIPATPTGLTATSTRAVIVGPSTVPLIPDHNPSTTL
jgi:hypothetical protein